MTLLLGGETYTDMAPFGHEKKVFLCRFMTLKRVIPSHDAFSDLFSCLIPLPLRKVSATNVEFTDKQTLHNFVNSHVEPDGIMYTDDQKRAIRYSSTIL